MTAFWLKADVMIAFPLAVDAADRAGFLLALYGSALSRPVMCGQGLARDMDLIAVPKRPEAEWSVLIGRFAIECGWREVAEPQVSLLGAVCVQMLTPLNTLVDLQVRGVPLRSLSPDGVRFPDVDAQREASK